MGIETATYIADLQAANPGSSDLRSQGDDHLRLLKAVLQATFPGAVRAFPIPSTISKTADYSIVKNDGGSTLYVSTAGGVVNLTLPTLTSTDAGWSIDFIKTNTGANPFFIKPPSGTLQSGSFSGLTAARRCIPGVSCRAIWDGSGFFVTRVTALPVGSLIQYQGSALPAGYEWPNGQTLASVATSYPEYNAAVGSGVTIDKRGRVGVALDNLGGSAANRLGGGFITGSAVGNVGGVDGVTLNTGQIPAHAHTYTDPQHQHLTAQAGGTQPAIVGTQTETKQAAGGNAALIAGLNMNGDTRYLTGLQSVGITINNTGGGGSHSNLQPSIMVSELLIVE